MLENLNNEEYSAIKIKDIKSYRNGTSNGCFTRLMPVLKEIRVGNSQECLR